jgi:hypothetical protein
MKGMGSFIYRAGSVLFCYFTNRVKLHDQWAPRLRRLVRRGWTGLPRHSSWFPGAEVECARDGSWSYRAW